VDQHVIKLTNVSKRYDDQVVVDSLNLAIRKGEIYGLLGPNGAGKSTTILMILGLAEPTSGSLEVCGLNSTRFPVEVKRRVGYLPEDVGFYDDYSGLENLLYTARLNRIPEPLARSKAEELLRKVGLQDASYKKAGKYSRGMRQRLGLADVLIKSPGVIILDEPTLGIDPRGMQELLNLISSLSRDEGITVLLCSHHLQQVQQVCDRVGLFVKGKLLAEGDLSHLSRSLQGSEPYTIEAGISAELSDSLSYLRDELLRIPSLKDVTFTDGLLRISCSADVSAEIARTIVRSGTDLYHLTKKEYGLDEIYNHYFSETNPA
jgi:ABC-2 type transport system ATP-binding protein